MSMNWETIKGGWSDYRGQLRSKWSKLTEEDLEVIAGNRDQLIGKLASRYGFSKEVAEKQVASFLATLVIPSTAGQPKVQVMPQK